MLVNVNTANKEELKRIPGVGEKVAQLLIQFREVYSVVKREALNLALRGNLSDEALDMIDFSVPRQDDPFDIDLSCLPSVPKTDSWEPLVSFAHQITARQSRSRSRSPTEPVTEVRHPLILPSAVQSRETTRSPVRESFTLLASHLADQESAAMLGAASNIHESQESRSCRTDSGPTSHREEEDNKHSVTRASRLSSRGKQEQSSRRRSRGSEGAKGSCRSKSPKAHRSSSGSRSPSSQRCSRKHSPKNKRTQRRHSKRASSVSRPRSSSRQRSRSYRRRSRSSRSRSNRSRSRSNREQKSRSHSVSVSRSRSRSKIKSKSKSRSSKKRSSSSTSSSRSVSRSRSVEHRSRKSDRKVKKEKKQDTSRSDSRSKSVKQSSRRGHSKIRKSRSQKKTNRHTRSRTRSTSRSASSSRSRSYHKRMIKTKRNKSKVNKHRRHSSSSSRSSSRSVTRSTRKKRENTRHARTKVHKHKPYLMSSSESQSRSRSRSRSQRIKERSRSKKTKRRSQRHHSSHSDSDTDSSVDRYSSRHGNPRKHPKTLRFDGKTNWLSFKKKFDSFRKVMKWSEKESKDYLMWSLEGKALDFLTVTKIDLEIYSFRKIMKKLEARFGVKELKETSKVKFRQAFQKQDDTLEDWADRVMTLAIPAFVDLPEEHLKQEAIARFCQGCTDMEAAKHACFQRPETIEQALNLVKHHQYISQAVDGKKVKRENEASVNAVQALSEARIEQLIASAIKDFTAKLQNSQSSSSEAEEKVKRKKSSSQCFFCKKFGHFKKECRVYQAWLRKKQKGKSEDSEGQSQDGKTSQNL